jgi:nicotinamide riboside transporter PnuC
MFLIIAAVFAILFYRAAYHEHMWTPLVLAQVGLFGVLWWANTKRISQRGDHWIRAREEERRLRKERVDRAREQVRREREGRDD